MPYLGNTPEQQAFTPAVDYFSGNGSTTAFTLSRPVASVAQVQAVIENVPQNPGDAYTVSGNTITFTSAPPSGTNNIYVYYTSPITQVIQPGQGTVGTTQIVDGAVTAAKLASGVLTPTAISDQLNASTGYFDLPTGTTAQRPGSPVAGMTRYNTSFNSIEFYNGVSWANVLDAPYTAEYLIVAGGGGGVSRWAQVACGGSGAGGVLSGSTSVTPNTAYTITVGAGGAGFTTTAESEASVTAANGANSSAFSQTAIGGGGGHGGQAGTAGSGGSGGGAGAGDGAGSAGSGTSGQGNAGGSGTASGSNSVRAAGGGGGAGAAGSNSSSGTCGAGGAGTSSFSAWGSATSTGQNVGGTFWYAGGSGGASTVASSVPQAAGGNGGGATGKAGVSAASPGNNGTANTGGGGGPLASQVGGTIVGGNGGSGVVIVRYLGSQRASGGTVTSAGGYTYHTFTTSGTFTA